jgi:ABC-type molybdate transport system permease subunit
MGLFFTVVLPLARPGFVTATILGFAHTVGEFGVVLMIGGNIPGRTRVMSVQIYDHVEALEYAQARWLAGGLVISSATHGRQTTVGASQGSVAAALTAVRQRPKHKRR